MKELIIWLNLVKVIEAKSQQSRCWIENILEPEVLPNHHIIIIILMALLHAMGICKV